MTGLRFCRRRFQGDFVPGHTHVGESKDGVWQLWREEGYSGPRCESSPSAPRPVKDPEAERKAHDRAAYNFASGRERTVPIDATAAARFAASMGLPAGLLRSQGRMFPEDARGETFVLPEYDGSGRVVCYLWRRLDGSKLNYGDPDVEVKRGLTLPDGWDDHPGPIYVPEGASDALALHAMGLCAVGRPSSRSGMEALAELLARRPDLAGRDVVLLGENDRKGERWEGRDGAWVSAQKLAELTNRPVKVAMPPEGAKDVRDWFRQRWVPGSDPKGLAVAFTRDVMGYRRVFRPTPKPQARPADSWAVTLRSLALAAAADIRADAQEQAKKQAECQENMARAVAAMRADRVRYECRCCRKLVLHHRETLTPHVATVRCEHWLCEGCRLYLIGREMAATLFHFHAAKQLYETVCSEAEWPAFRRRVERLGGEYRKIAHGEGYYVVTDVLARDFVPVSAESACYEFQATLDAWRGDHRPATSSHGWGLLAEESQTDLQVLGVADPSMDLARTSEMAAEVGAVVVPKSGRPDRPRHVISLWQIHRPGGWDERTLKRFASGMMDGWLMPEGLSVVVDESLLPPARTTLEQDLQLV